MVYACLLSTAFVHAMCLIPKKILLVLCIHLEVQHEHVMRNYLPPACVEVPLPSWFTVSEVAILVLGVMHHWNLVFPNLFQIS